MKIHYLLAAEEEILAVVKYYDRQAEGLAADFYAEFQRARRDIVDFPEMWGKVGNGYRRKLINRYPYGIIYRIEDSQIIVVALAGTSRAEGYWLKDREL